MRLLHPHSDSAIHSCEAVSAEIAMMVCIFMLMRTRSAVVGLVRSYGKILAEEDIGFNAVCPNKIRTDIYPDRAVYDEAERRGVIVPMERLLEAFEKLLPGGEFGNVGGECLEVAPQLGVRKVEWMPFINDESRISAEMTYQRSHYLHEVVES